jgi:hypothetical protein
VPSLLLRDKRAFAAKGALIMRRGRRPLVEMGQTLMSASPPYSSLCRVHVPSWRCRVLHLEPIGRIGRCAKSRRGLGTVTDLLLRQAHTSRAGAQGDNDYDVIGTDGIASGAFLRPPHRVQGHSGCGRWLTQITRTERSRMDMRQLARPLCTRFSLGAGTERRDP